MKLLDYFYDKYPDAFGFCCCELGLSWVDEKEGRYLKWELEEDTLVTHIHPIIKWPRYRDRNREPNKEIIQVVPLDAGSSVSEDVERPAGGRDPGAERQTADRASEGRPYAGVPDGPGGGRDQG
jgi:hypothetical protein